MTVTDSPLIAHADPAMTQALESSIDNRTMAGITDGRFSNMLQRGANPPSRLTAAALAAPRNRYAESADDNGSSMGALISINQNGRTTNEPVEAAPAIEPTSGNRSPMVIEELGRRTMEDPRIINQIDDGQEVFNDNVSPDRLIRADLSPRVNQDASALSYQPDINVRRGISTDEAVGPNIVTKKRLSLKSL